MRVIKLAIGLLLVAGLLVLWAAPIGPLPGVFIGGTPTATPASWPDTREVDEVVLSVGEGLPRAVIIWVIQVDGELYVVGARDSGWTTMIGSGGPVKLRLQGRTYDLQAERLTQGWEDVLTAYVAKYEPGYPEIIADFPSADQAEDFVAVFRLNR